MMVAWSNMAQGDCQEKMKEIPDTKSLAAENEKRDTHTESSAKDEEQASCRS